MLKNTLAGSDELATKNAMAQEQQRNPQTTDPVKHALDKWDRLNQLWYDVYCERGDDTKVRRQLHELIDTAKREKDSQFVARLVHLNKVWKDKHTEESSVLWKTAKIGDKIYPPICTTAASPVAWSPEQCKLSVGHSIRVQDKYTTTARLTPNEPRNGCIEQNPDINNCSFAASMINIRRHKIDIPEVVKLPNNYYHVNLSFNGCSNRLVTVNANSIPTNASGDQQLSIYSDNLDDKLIELAYLQLKNGSYSITGSNVTMDTFLLTGFLPEIVKTDFYDFDTLYKYFKSDYCLMGLGSHGDKSRLASNLLVNHDYSVIDFNSTDKKIILQDPLNSKLNLQFDMTQIKKFFNQLYINWDSSKLFNNCKTLTFWYNTEVFNKYNTNIDKPNFLVENTSNNTELIWILLESHITTQDINEEINISYLRKLSRANVYDELYLPTNTASNIGLQLLKLELKPNEKLHFLCYSNFSKYFTLRLYSVLPNINLTQCKNESFAKSLEFSELASDMTDSYGSSYYFQNPTFQIEIPDNLQQQHEILLNLLLTTEDKQCLLNCQLFHANDYLLQKPIIFDNRYTLQNYSKFQIPILTNQKYNIVCSCRNNIKDLINMKLITTFTNQDLINKCGQDMSLIKLSKINPIFNGLLYQEYQHFTFPPNTTRLKILIDNDTFNSLFIRSVIDDSNNNNAEIRCNIFDRDDHTNLHFDDKFYKQMIVIPNFEINANNTPVLLMELNKKFEVDIRIKIFIGSKKRIKMIKFDKKKNIK